VCQPNSGIRARMRVHNTQSACTNVPFFMSILLCTTRAIQSSQSSNIHCKCSTAHWLLVIKSTPVINLVLNVVLTFNNDLGEWTWVQPASNTHWATRQRMNNFRLR